MKVLWIICGPMGGCAAAFGLPGSQSGGWISACADRTKPARISGELELSVVATADRYDHTYSEEDLINYYLVDIPRKQGRPGGLAVQRKWCEFIDKIKPDLIQVWGTEFPIALDIKKATKNIPVLIFIQGIMSAIAEHSFGDMPLWKMLKGGGVFAPFKAAHLLYNRMRLKKEAKLEPEILKYCDGIFVDGDWTTAQYASYNLDVYRLILPTSDEFDKHRWSPDNFGSKTVFTAFGASPIKGTHVIMKAFGEVIKEMPDAKLIIPGDTPFLKKAKTTETVYASYLRHLIKKHNLKDNIVLTGRLNPEQMAERLAQSDVFVLTSSIEHQSSTLREAMTMGCPSVVSYVGSVADYAKNDINSYVYRYNEHKTLAFYIKKLLNDADTAKKFSENARKTIAKQYPQDVICDEVMTAYRTAFEKKS